MPVVEHRALAPGSLHADSTALAAVASQSKHAAACNTQEDAQLGIDGQDASPTGECEPRHGCTRSDTALMWAHNLSNIVCSA